MTTFQHFTDTTDLRDTVAVACRILASRGLVDGILGHVSVRVADDELLVRCRRESERGLARSVAADIGRIRFDAAPVDVAADMALPNELPIHVELMRRRPHVGAVIHAHPPAALLCGLAGLQPRPVFGAFNIPAMRLAKEGVPVYPRSVLITRPDLAKEMLEAMGDRSVCLLRGHGITVAAPSIEAATVLACNLNTLLEVTVELARLGARPDDLDAADLAELPDLGSGFNDRFTWQSLVADAEAMGY